MHHSWRLSGERIACITLAQVILAACSTIPRMDVTFEADPTGASPSTYPQPSPPNDVLASYTSQRTTSLVVANPAGGKWLRITPQQTFVIDPDGRKRAVLVTSETFTSGANIRGHLRVRLDGPGRLYFGLRPVQGQQMADFVAGFAVGNYLGNSPALNGQVDLLNPFHLAAMEGNYPLFSSAGNLANIPPGKVIDINWSLDQPSRTVAASVSGGPSRSTAFAASSGGVSTTPIQQLSLWVWLGNPSSNTAAFIDDLRIEEYK